MKSVNWDKIKHFSESEFRCNCKKCQKNKTQPQMDEEFIVHLDDLRDQLGHPIYISSGYRCKKHNKKVGGSKNSYHLIGKAADIAIYGKSAFELLQLAFLNGFTGVGIAQKGPYKKRFIHLDIGQEGYKRPTVWSY